HVNVETPFEVSFDDALVPLEIEDVMSIDERITEEDRLGVASRRFSPVAKEPDRPTFEDDVVWSGAGAGLPSHFDGSGDAQHSSPEALLLGAVGYLPIDGNIEQRRNHLTSLPFLFDSGKATRSF